nr:MAG TPA: hypothetical protein [Caudoviricetes sp.]
MTSLSVIFTNFMTSTKIIKFVKRQLNLPWLTRFNIWTVRAF